VNNGAAHDAPFACDFADNASGVPASFDESLPSSEFREDQEEREQEAIREAQAEHWRSRIVQIEPDWLTEAPPKRKWILRDKRRPNFDGVLPLGKAGDIIAQGGGFKTSLAIQLAVAVATGADWLDTFSVATPGRVLLLLGEEDREEVRRRVYQSTRGNGRLPEPGDIETLALSGQPCALIERDAKGNPKETVFLEWLRNYIAASQWALVIVDPLSRFAGPDAEVDNAQGTRFVEVIESFCEASGGGTALCNHHTNKLARGNGRGLVDATGARGVTSIGDGFRWEASLTVERLKFEHAEEQERLGKIVTLAQTKTNYSREFDPVALRRDQDGRLVPLDDDDAETVQQARLNEPDRSAKQSARESAKAVGNRQRDAEDDAAARDIIARHPDAPVRALVAHLKSARGCGSDRAHDAIVRIRRGQ
jgi:regulatory protein RepA